jgi:hypothetical protein
MAKTIAEIMQGITDDFNGKFGGKEVDIEDALEFAPDHSVKHASLDVFKEPTLKQMSEYARSQGIGLRLIFDQVSVDMRNGSDNRIDVHVMRWSDNSKFKIGKRSQLV